MNKLWETRIGLEVHAQITKSVCKLFSGGSVRFGEQANSSVSLFDMATPGTLPILNKHCVEQAIRTGIALNGTVNTSSRFVRKHYFYQDLPLGYQITQQNEPIISKGKLDGVNILRVQLEQDSGKSLHDLSPTSTFVDLNRAGTALLEIVTAPDLRNAEQACSFILSLQKLLQYLEVSDGIMAEGSLRCDLNISMHKRDGTLDGDRVEVKNLNTLRGIVRAVEYEEQRQLEILSSGVKVPRETRSWQAQEKKTIRLRGKEDMLDYRFMEDPNLPPLILSPQLIESIRSTIPELPQATQSRLQELGLSEEESVVLLYDYKNVAYFDELFRKSVDKSMVSQDDSHQSAKLAKLCWSKLANELFGRLKASNLSLSECPVTTDQLSSIIHLEYSKQISGKIGKHLLNQLFQGNGKDVYDIVERDGLLKESRVEVLRGPCEDVINEFPKEVEELKNGKDRRLNFLVGKVISKLNGRADPSVVKNIILGLIKN